MIKKEDEGEKRRGAWSYDLLEKDQQLVVPCSLQLKMCKLVWLC